MDSNSIRQLIRALAGEPGGDEIVLRETHISWVILCGELAYKIKKPVNFGFLDFSTLELRRHFCEQELLLNRRFAPELYLSVLPVTGSDQELQISGEGPAIDYAVVMRRFDESQLLDKVAARDGLDRHLLRALARELARLHDSAPRCRPDCLGGEPGTPTALRNAMEQNYQQARDYPLAPEDSAALDQVEQWTRQRFTELLPQLEHRVADGLVIDGHGDAHLGNIALVNGAVRLFDCIEFNPALRIMDSVSEIAFLTMDLDARGHGGESHRLLTDYLEYSGDYEGLPLLDLYRSYFAVVRAKVNLLREQPTHPALADTDAYGEFRRYLELARQYTHPRQGFLAITHGVSGSGKSTVAGELVAASGAVRIRSDVERKRLFGLAPEQRSAAQDAARLYSSEMSRRTFARLETLTRIIIRAGFPVIVDATFLHQRVRESYRKLALELGLPYVIIDCEADPEQLRQRLVERERQQHDASEADVAVMESQLTVDQPLSGKELDHRLRADSAEQGAALWQRLCRQCQLKPGQCPPAN